MNVEVNFFHTLTVTTIPWNSNCIASYLNIFIFWTYHIYIYHEDEALRNWITRKIFSLLIYFTSFVLCPLLISFAPSLSTSWLFSFHYTRSEIFRRTVNFLNFKFFFFFYINSIHWRCVLNPTIKKKWSRQCVSWIKDDLWPFLNVNSSITNDISRKT